MSNNYKCDGNSCCLIPGYRLPVRTTEKCLNYDICFNENINKDSFCDDCLKIPYENKKRIIKNGCDICSICSKYSTVIKREYCDHYLCI